MNRRIKSGWNLESETEPTVLDHIIAAMISAVALIVGTLSLWAVTVVLVSV